MVHEFILKVFVLILESKTKNKIEIFFVVVNFPFLKKAIPLVRSQIEN